jgi:hypothetical protein
MALRRAVGKSPGDKNKGKGEKGVTAPKVQRNQSDVEARKISCRRRLETAEQARAYPRETQEMVFDADDHAFRVNGGEKAERRGGVRMDLRVQ